jgi:hypothetical protein
VLNRGELDGMPAPHLQRLSGCPCLIESEDTPSGSRNGPRNQDIDSLTVLEDITPARASFIRWIVGEMVDAFERSIQGFNVVDVEPQIIVDGHDGGTEGNERAPSDKQRSHVAIFEDSKEVLVVKLCVPHL